MGLDQRKGRALSLQPITQAARVATHPKPPQNSFPQLSKCIDNEARAILCLPVRATSSYLMSPLVDTFGKPEHLEKAELVDLCGEKWGLGTWAAPLSLSLFKSGTSRSSLLSWTLCIPLFVGEHEKWENPRKYVTERPFHFLDSKLHQYWSHSNHKQSLMW